jgi:hypothetical protein
MKTNLQNIKYLELFQTNIQEYNEKMQNLRDKAQGNMTDKEFKKILWNEAQGESLRHHRDLDFTLSPEELETLMKDKIFWYPPERFSRRKLGSFSHFYLKAYENDMPVVISTDSILHAFHLSLTSYMDYIEMLLLCTVLIEMLEKVLQDIDSMKKTHEGDKQMLKMLEGANIYYTVAHRLLTKRIASTNATDPNSEEISPKPEDPTKEPKAYKLFEDPDYIVLEGDPKLHMLIGTYSRIAYHNTTRQPRYISKETEQTIDHILKLVSEEKPNHLNIFESTRDFDFSMLKPRGRYTKTLLHQNYFQSLMWLSYMKFSTKPGSDEIDVIWFLMKIFSERYTENPDEEGNKKENPLKIFKDGYRLIAGIGLVPDFKDIYDLGRQMGFSGFLLNKTQRSQIAEALVSFSSRESFQFMKQCGGNNPFTIHGVEPYI